MVQHLKRDNFSIDEILKIIEGCMLVGVDSEYNVAIGNVYDTFYGFKRPVEEFGATAYEPATDTIFHVGQIPNVDEIHVDEDLDDIKLIQ